MKSLETVNKPKKVINSKIVKSNKTKSASTKTKKDKKIIKDFQNDNENVILETQREYSENNNQSNYIKNNLKSNNLNNNQQRINSYEIKQFGISNNLTLLNNQLENCDRLIDIQGDLFNKISRMNRNIMENNLKFERSIAKCESENYFNLFKNYSDVLEELIVKLNSQLEQIEELQNVKEELKSMKIKEEIRNAKYSEEKLAVSSKFDSFKNFLSLELNNFIDFLNENCSENNFIINKSSKNCY